MDANALCRAGATGRHRETAAAAGKRSPGPQKGSGGGFGAATAAPAGPPARQSKLHDAIRDRDTRLLKRALELHADKLNTPDPKGLPPLHCAAATGHAPAMQLLLEAGADVAARDAAGITALHIACATGHDALITLLLEAGADKEAADQAGTTPLALAAQHGREGCVAVLVEAGAPCLAAAAEGLPACLPACR